MSIICYSSDFTTLEVDLFPTRSPYSVNTVVESVETGGPFPSSGPSEVVSSRSKDFRVQFSTIAVGHKVP